MSKVSVFGKFWCVEGRGEEMDAALRDVVEASKGVDGVESYSYHRGDGDSYWFFAIMTNMETAQAHADNEGMQAAMAKFMPLLAGPPEMVTATPIAAVGLDV